MCSGFQKFQLPLRLVKAMKLLNIIKNQPVVSLVNFDYQSILSIAFITCGIDRSEKIEKFLYFQMAEVVLATGAEFTAISNIQQCS